MTSLVMIYRDEHRQALKEMMEAFEKKANDLGVILKVSDFHEL